MSQQITGIVLIKSWKIFISGKWRWNSVSPTGYLKVKKSVKNQGETSLDSQNEHPL